MEVVPSDVDIGREVDLFPNISSLGFPPRAITRKLTGEKKSGEWIVAYQAEQRKRLNTTLVPAQSSKQWYGASATLTNNSRRLSVPKNTPASFSAKFKRTLNNSLLMKIGYVDRCQDLSIINISGIDLESYSDQLFFQFVNLNSINASDNVLPLEAFERFPALQELELSLNNITNIDISLNTFTKLSILDLSYNNLSSSAITSLGKLPGLKELRLTGNNLVYLPIEMSQLQQVNTTGNKDQQMQISFPNLEKLWLDDNHLSDTGTFAILAGLRRLQYLNLDDNQLSSIPRLRLLGTSSLRLSSHRSLSGEAIGTSKGEETGTSPGGGGLGGNGGERPSSSPSLSPFPALHTLSLIDNMIVSSENLVPCSSWPSLKILIITGNPIVSLNKGLPVMLDHELVKLSGINIIRTKASPVKKERAIIGTKAKDFIKVSLAPPPTIPKKPILLALEPPHSSMSSREGDYDNDNDYDDFNMDAFSEPSSITESSIITNERDFTNDREGEGGEGERRSGPNIFMTQVQNEDNEDISLPPRSQSTDSKQTEQQQQQSSSPVNQQSEDPVPSQTAVSLLSVEEEFKKKQIETAKRFKDLPVKYKGFESLMESSEDELYYDRPPLPANAHSCAQALRHALRNPLLLTNASTASRTRSTDNDNDTIESMQYLKKSPVQEVYDDRAAVSRKEELIQTVLTDVKTHEVTIETNLADMLESRYVIKTDESANNNKETKRITREGGKLLKKLQDKFDSVCESSLEAIDALESIQRITRSGGTES